MYQNEGFHLVCIQWYLAYAFNSVVPNLGVATPKGVAEHFKGGRKAVANATAKVNVDRARYRSASSMCFDVCHFSLSYFIRIAL